MKKFILALILSALPALAFAGAGFVSSPSGITLKADMGSSANMNAAALTGVVVEAGQSAFPIPDSLGYYYWNGGMPPFIPPSKAYDTPVGWPLVVNPWDSTKSTILYGDMSEQPATFPIVVKIVVAAGQPSVMTVTPFGGTPNTVPCVFLGFPGAPTNCYINGQGTGALISFQPTGYTDATRSIDIGFFAVPALSYSWYGHNVFGLDNGNAVIGYGGGPVLVYKDGAQAAGKVLTSDVNGFASWQTTPAAGDAVLAGTQTFTGQNTFAQGIFAEQYGTPAKWLHAGPLPMGGPSNIALGFNTMSAVTTDASDNVAIGNMAGANFGILGATYRNVGLGADAMTNLGSGQENFGVLSGMPMFLFSGNYNAFIQSPIYSAGMSVISGDYNILMGPASYKDAIDQSYFLSINNLIVGDFSISSATVRGDLTTTGTSYLGFEHVSNTCLASATCTASCAAGKASFGGSCSATPQISPLDSALGASDYTCNAGVGTSDLTAIVSCARVGN